MGKQKYQATPQKAQSYNHPSMNTNQNNRRQNQNSKVSDLVTPKQKQIGKKYKLGIKNKKINGMQDEGEDFTSSNDQREYYEQNEKQDPNMSINERFNRYEQRASRQAKQQLLQTVNRLIAKNKINSKTAFQVPLLSISDFAIDDEEERGEIAWSKMSSILQNSSKIYGIRVQSMEEFINKMSQSLCRKEAQTNDAKQAAQKKTNDGNSNQQQTGKKKSKLTEFISTQNKVDLTAHLQKNSQGLDINLKTKLMMRKDPLFERTSRKFDYCTFASLFMNTLQFGDGLYLEINAKQQKQKNSSQPQQKMIDQQQKQKDLQKDFTNLNLNTEPKQNQQNNDSLCYIMKDLQNISTVSQDYKKINEGFSRISKFVKVSNNQYEQYQQNKQQHNQDYQKYINFILEGKFKSAFQSGKNNQYIQSQDEQQKQKQYHIQFNKLSNIQNKILHRKNDKIMQNQKQNISKEILNRDENIQVKNNINQVQKNENIERKAIFLQQQAKQDKADAKQTQNQNFIPKSRIRKINQVITIRQSLTETEKKVSTRKKQLNSKIKQIISAEKKGIKIIKQEKQMFDSNTVQNFKRVLRRQKVNKIAGSNEDYLQKNLLQPLIYCGFHTEHLICLRPIATKQDLRKQRNIQKQKYIQGQQINNKNQKQENKLQQPNEPQQILNENKEQNEGEQQIQLNSIYKKQPKMKAIKDAIKQILKQKRKITFKQLKQKYKNHYGEINTATLFIAMLHVTNQGFIKAKQFGTKNFIIQL